MKTPLHFDGHGVNDAEGTRIFKLCTKQWRDDGRGLEPEFVQTSNLLASAPELLQFAKDVVRYLEAGTISRRSDRDFVIEMAQELINKAESIEP